MAPLPENFIESAYAAHQVIHMFSPPSCLRLLLPVLVAISLLPACHKKEDPLLQTGASSAIAASGETETSLEKDIESIPGASLYRSVCASCHDDGTGKAPRLGNKADWESRISQGEEALMRSVINGKGIMPPKGTALDASEEDLRATIRYMTGTAGSVSP